MSRFIRPLLNVVIVSGLVIAAIPVGQNLYGHWSQRQLAAQWQAEETQLGASRAQKRGFEKGLAHTVAADNDSPVMAVSAKSPKKLPAWPLTKFSIPDIGLETFVVQGIDPASLRRGPGHYPDSAPPGSGNCVIAGHRNVYGSYFYRLDELIPGQPIVLENKNGKWTYHVTSVYITPDTDLTVLEQPPAKSQPQLTLVTCTLPHSSARIVLRADLDE